MDFNIGDTVNWTNGGFTAGNATVIQIVDPIDFPNYDAKNNPAYMVQFADGNWTIVDGENIEIVR